MVTAFTLFDGVEAIARSLNWTCAFDLVDNHGQSHRPDAVDPTSAGAVTGLRIGAREQHARAVCVISSERDMSGLAELLVTAKPLETSGARSANRADYQKDWALCLLLRLHESSEDYLLLLEHHDDVAVVDSPSTPTKAQFFQIKTAGKPWTMNALTARTKGKAGPKPSILGKLFHSAKQFGDAVEKLSLVSNAHFSVELVDGSGGQGLANICFVQLSEDEKQRARTRLEEELGVDAPLPWEGIAYLVVDDLSVDDHATHARGKVSAFLEKLGHADSAVGPVYRTLADEVRRRADHEGNCLSIAELAARKGISRAEFTAMLARACTGSTAKAWEQCRAQLALEGSPFTAVARLHRSWNKHEVYRMEAANLNIQQFRQEIVKRVEEQLQAGAKLSLTDLVATISPALVKPPTYTDDDVRAAIMFEAYAAGQTGGAVQEADKKSEEAGT